MCGGGINCKCNFAHPPHAQKQFGWTSNKILWIYFWGRRLWNCLAEEDLVNPLLEKKILNLFGWGRSCESIGEGDFEPVCLKKILWGAMEDEMMNLTTVETEVWWKSLSTVTVFKLFSLETRATLIWATADKKKKCKSTQNPPLGRSNEVCSGFQLHLSKNLFRL